MHQELPHHQLTIKDENFNWKSRKPNRLRGIVVRKFSDYEMIKKICENAENL
jgi:hypothetical protein